MHLSGPARVTLRVVTAVVLVFVYLPLLVVMVNSFNPDRVVLGGGVMRRYALLAPAMEAEMRRRALAANAAVARLCPASLGGRAGLLGAAMLAWDGLAG